MNAKVQLLPKYYNTKTDLSNTFIQFSNVSYRFHRAVNTIILKSQGFNICNIIDSYLKMLNMIFNL